MMALLRLIDLEADLPRPRASFDAQTLEDSRRIVEDVRTGGDEAALIHARKLGDLIQGKPLVYSREMLEDAAAQLPLGQRDVLKRSAERIRAFAEAQRACLHDLTMKIPGGEAGHEVVPVDAAGCYAPGGRFPLPSSVLMTVLAARAAGVKSVWVASPRPEAVTLAAAGIAGADGLLAIGGAQAIAALTFGCFGMPSADVVVGPGNRWVTAAKQVISAYAGIDMLAGPSELVVLADASADAAVIAADLLAQAEHDPDAVPILVTTCAALPAKVEAALLVQLETLPTRRIAEQSLQNGFAYVASNVDAAVSACNRLAPEHLQVMMEDVDLVRGRLRHCGGLFLGAGSAEVLGDYGAGPNHTLPTGGSSRSHAGLSVFTFLRARTWLRIDDGAESAGLVRDAAALARLEGLEGHARAAEHRLVR